MSPDHLQPVTPPDGSARIPAGAIQWRYLKDRVATVAVSIGGLGVIVAVLLIFFYLLYVVFPLFRSAHLEAANRYASPGGQGDTQLLAVEEQAQIGMRLKRSGELLFFSLGDGLVLARETLPIAADFASELDREQGLLAVMNASGELVLVQHKYSIGYPEHGERIITPQVLYPYGRDSLRTGSPAPTALAVGADEYGLTVATADAARQIAVQAYAKTSSFLTDEETLEPQEAISFKAPIAVDQLLIDPLQEWLYVLDHGAGKMAYYDLRKTGEALLVELVDVVTQGTIEHADMLAGGISLVVAGSDGQIVQWFPLRDSKGNYRLQRVRDFASPSDAAVVRLSPELRRRGFVAIDASGKLGIYYATSGRIVLQQQISQSSLAHATFSPRADVLLVEDQSGQLHVFHVHNEHPEVSWSSLWEKVWYESYPQPQYVWQSSSASGDFEPKFSLAPLSFGTLKAAFYAMLFAVPLALGGAIFTAYFMSPELRQIVKPTIEVMEALPTVILGFLAGLWLAPFIEGHLPGIFLLLLVLPLTMPLAGWLWSRLPAGLRHRVPNGWQPVLLILPICLAGGLALMLSRPVEVLLFGGSMPFWLDSVGIDFDQRNSLVVGLVMGFAVIPTIFSIAEDAIFSVPKQLTQGSLALGATPWQSLVRVVLPTASPGMFSALMIGFGRAVGETMIVLMATGNTPIMDFNIFEGFRTLSANIAVEMPESEVGSSHFRILFLAGLVLFLFTFAFNTLAEVIRQRLRGKYSTL